MIDRDRIARLIPHRGAMCLIERVLEWDTQRILVASGTHRAAGHPLAAGGRLRAVHACEYGGQAAAIHGGLVAEAAGEQALPGLIVLLREVCFARDYLEDLEGELLIEAQRLMSAASSWQYAFRVRHADTELASGRVAVMARPDLIATLRAAG